MAENFYQKRIKKTFKGIILSPFIFIIAILPLKVFAQAYDVSGILYVNQGVANSGDGSSWATPLKELRDAVNIANSDQNVHQIWVAKGTYTPTTGTDRTVSFNLPGGISAYGGFFGNESNLTDRNVASNPTILSGDIGVTGDNTDNSYSVVTIKSTTSAVTVDGFTITAANNNTATPGGGLVVTQNTGTITLNFLTIIGNTAQIGGGADIEYSGSVTVNQSVISNNTANGGDAGGMEVYNSVITLNNTVFDGNLSQNPQGSFAEGGGMELDGTNGGTNVTCNNCVFNNNQAVNPGSAHGGAIINFGGTLNLTNCTLYNNSITPSFFGSNSVSDEGNDDQTALNFINTIIWNNQSFNLAIDEAKYSASVYVTNCDIADANYTNGNINTDPLFTNPTNPIGPDGIWGTADDGLMLSCLSPAHYAGTSNGATATDITGAPRSYPPDMGAYQQNGQPVQPTISIAITSGGNCPNTSLTFTATPSSGGTNPSFQWQVNGNNVGTNSPSISLASLNPGDVVTCTLTTDYTVCVSTMTAYSNSITINSLPQVTPLAITTVNAGSPYYGQQIMATGGQAPYTFTLSGGTLPNGIVLGTDGTLSGTSDVPGSYQFTVQVTESGCNNTATQMFSADINGLSSLIPSTGVLNQTFDPGTNYYNLSVPNATSSISFTPTAGNQNVMININGTAVLSGSPSPLIPLSVGDNTITINETAQDLYTVNTYTVTVTRAPSNIATLNNLAVSSGTLSPQFTTANTTYADTVAAGTSSINVTPTVTDQTATVTVNGMQVASGSPSNGIPLTLGANIITTVVTAQDGSTTDTYTLTVYLPPSTNASLSNLAVSNGTLNPAFDPGTTGYEDDVDNSVTSITVTPTAADPNATITVNGAPVQSGSASAPFNLNVGSNAITTIITAQDGITTNTYTINVVRAPSSNANLANLTASSGILNPTFDPGTTGYEDDVDNSVTSITVTPTVADPTATITVNGTPVLSGSASTPVTLNVGSNAITTVVIAQDGVTTNTYTINVVRAPSSNANLSNLTVSNGTLDPAFDPGTTGYENDVDNSVTSVTVTPTTADPAATITVNGMAVLSGSASTPVTLNVGSNAITTVVIAQDGVTTNTYTINVVRAPSSNSTLANLTVSNGTLNPAFDTGTAGYEDDVNNSVTSITVTPTAADPTATIMVNGSPVLSGSASAPVTLNVGSNSITTVVTAQDGITTNTYTINVVRAPSSNANLTNLTVSNGTLNPAFDTGTAGYEDDVDNSVTSITVTPTVADPTATITVNGLLVSSGSASAPVTLNVGSNAITTVVTAQDGVTTNTYTINVVRAPSSNANLVNLTVSSGILNPSFDAGTTGYEDDVENSVTSITVTPTVADPTATITVNGSLVSSGSASAPVTLNVGSNAVTTIVTAQDGITTNTYTINVVRTSSTTSLANLTISSGTLNPTFSTTTTSYIDTVSNAVTSVTVTPTASDANAAITVNDATVASGTASQAIPLNPGANVITTVVTAQDGSSTQTYSITVTRAKATQTITFYVLGDVAYGTPDFDPGAFSSSNLPIVYTSSDPTVATIVNGKVHIIGTGSVTITASVADDPNYYPATPVSRSFTVNKADQTISTITIPILVPGNEVDLSSITASSGLPLTFNLSDSTIVTIRRDSLVALQVGTVTLSVVQPGNNFYNPAESDYTIPVVVIDQDDQLVVHPAVTPNGDGINDFLLIEGIKNYPINTVTVANRNGVKIYSASGYDNESLRFDGHSNINGQFQPAGTYFYLIDYMTNGKHRHKAGFIVLKY